MSDSPAVKAIVRNLRNIEYVSCQFFTLQESKLFEPFISSLVEAVNESVVGLTSGPKPARVYRICSIITKVSRQPSTKQEFFFPLLEECQKGVPGELRDVLHLVRSIVSLFFPKDAVPCLGRLLFIRYSSRALKTEVPGHRHSGP